jgi:hypothetical protein
MARICGSHDSRLWLAWLAFVARMARVCGSHDSHGSRLWFAWLAGSHYGATHVMYTIVDRYDNERETWSKSRAMLAYKFYPLHNLCFILSYSRNFQVFGVFWNCKTRWRDESCRDYIGLGVELLSKPVNNHPNPPFFSYHPYHRPPMVPHLRTHGISVNRSPQSHSQFARFFQHCPKTLMEIPVQPPFPFAFRESY